jgi:hypothetical protein
MKISDTARLRNFIAILISLSILFFLFYKIDARKVLSVLSGSNLWLVLLAVVISLSVNIFLGALKWKRILCALGHLLPFKEALAIRSGFLPFKLVFPLKSSEIIKAFYLEKQKKIAFGRAASSLLVDRALNLFVTLSIFLVGLILTDIKISIFFPIMALLVLLGFLFLRNLRGIFLKIAKVMHPKFYQFSRQLFSGFEEINVKEKTILTAYSAIYQFSEFVNTYILFKAIGVDVPFSLLLVFVPLVMVVSNLPLTVMGLGSREALLVFLFAKYSQASSLLSGGLLVSFVEHVLPVVFGLFFIKSLTNFTLEEKNKFSVAV